MNVKGKVQLDRALSKSGIASRSQAKAWIEAGRVAVNGQAVHDPAFLVVPERMRLTIDGKAVTRAVSRTIMLYKPRGVVTTRSDEKGRRTVYDLLPEGLWHLHPVGRLDMATTGLLLMTTDTRLSDFLTDPGHGIPRVYTVSVSGRITDEDVKKLSQGIRDKGELLKADSMTLRKASNKESHLIVQLTEGKNREIRRMFEALGSQVTALKRVAFGNLNLGELKVGEFREVWPKEILPNREIDIKIGTQRPKEGSTHEQKNHQNRQGGPARRPL
jgi:23S rRNA pseudouridine2605 synthase